MGILSWVKTEAKEVGLVVLYFFFCFSIILTLKKLMLEAYQIEFYGFSRAVIGALIVGKVVVVLDKTKAGTRLDANHSLGAAALYKTMIYSAVTFMALLAEEMFHAYRESGTLGEVFMDVMMHEDRHNIFARVLCIGLAFMGYHLYRGIDSRLGKGTLRHMVFKRP